ncbi:hypothetical protein [Chitinophaga varians]|uniref:hypothetical protein n=1 Tax=Chitinophaga varians TaxID=2202339 RepID=UPI00165EBF93|nr:hypothetical protein [Chitinophaga varians]MBC9913155.1 hypothetical protein [Chitinophaga varians]
MSTELHPYQIDAISEILECNGINVSSETVTAIAKDLYTYLELEQETGAYQHSAYKPECENCKHAASELKRITQERNEYRESLQIMRKVAK